LLESGKGFDAVGGLHYFCEFDAGVAQGALNNLSHDQ
jgi:hypothetical protein